MPTDATIPPVGGWKPTRKWIGGAIIGLLTIVGQAIATGAWDTTEWGALVTLGIALAGSYFVTNDQAPGGVPEKKPESPS